MADVDPALIGKACEAAQRFANGETTISGQMIRAAFQSLGIPAAALNALYRGEAVVVNETTGLPYIESDALKARE